MKISTNESVKHFAGMALSVLFALYIYRANLSLFLRFAVTAAMVYGAGCVACGLIGKVWNAARTFADNRKVRSPRVATVAVVLLMLFVAVLTLEVLSEIPGGKIAVLAIEGGFLVVGWFFIAGRLFIRLWDACAGLLHRPSVEGGNA
jgi:hypothetical protein